MRAPEFYLLDIKTFWLKKVLAGTELALSVGGIFLEKKPCVKMQDIHLSKS
jgi:hypothetical protein